MKANEGLCPQTGLVRDYDAEAARSAKRSQAIRLASESLARDAISRICAQHELESDEFSTREEKAAALL